MFIVSTPNTPFCRTRGRTKTRLLRLSASAPRMKEVVAGRCFRMSESWWSDIDTCSLRRGMEDGKEGASSMTERTCVIPRLASWFAFSAVERQVRYRRGAIKLATRLLCLVLERSGRISCGCFSSISCCTIDGKEVWYCWKKDSSKKGIPKLMKVEVYDSKNLSSRDAKLYSHRLLAITRTLQCIREERCDCK